MSRLPRLGGALVLGLTVLVAGCGSGDARPRVTVAAASDLRYAFEEMAPLYEARCACDLVLSFGSSGMFATQIEEGLRVDVFASADSGYVDDLERAGLVLEGTKELYAIGRLALAVPAESALRPETLEDLGGPAFRRIAIANPDHAPYGRAARQALEKAGLWEKVRGRLVLGENASLAAQYVETGNADAGIVPLSLAVQRRAQLRYALLSESLHEPLRQVAVVIASTRQREAATGFIRFVNGPEGRLVMRRYGFVLPGELLQQ